MGVEPQFPSDARASLEVRLSLFHIYFSDRLPGAKTGRLNDFQKGLSVFGVGKRRLRSGKENPGTSQIL